MTSAGYGELLSQGYTQPANPYLHTAEPTSQAYHQHGMAAVLPTQVSGPETGYGLDQTHMIATQMPRRVSHVPAHYSSPQQHLQVQLAYHQQSQAQGSARKRSHGEFALDYGDIQQMQAHAAHAGMQVPVELTPHGQHAQLQAQAYGYASHELSPTDSHSGQMTTHHHHRLPNQQPPSKFHRTGYGEEQYITEEHGPPCVVGQPGMPEPAPKPKGPKLKFTPEDDQLLVELKETKNLTWKQIADFFPGRSSGTLQVRYCTKLKAKTMVWTEDMVSLHVPFESYPANLRKSLVLTIPLQVDRLRHATEEYENDRWRIISGKVGNGFSAAACRDKIAELNGEIVEGSGDLDDLGEREQDRFDDPDLEGRSFTSEQHLPPSQQHSFSESHLTQHAMPEAQEIG